VQQDERVSGETVSTRFVYVPADWLFNHQFFRCFPPLFPDFLLTNVHRCFIISLAFLSVFCRRNYLFRNKGIGRPYDEMGRNIVIVMQVVWTVCSCSRQVLNPASKDQYEAQNKGRY